MMDQNTIVTKALRDQLIAKGNFWCWFEAEGSIQQSAHSPLAPHPDLAQEMVCRDLLKALNTHVANNGTWVVTVTNAQSFVHGTEYGTIWMLWMDADGDVQIPIEITDPLHVVLEEGPDCRIEHALEAYAMWQDMQGVMELKPHQKKKYAKGEKMELVDMNAFDFIGD